MRVDKQLVWEQNLTTSSSSNQIPCVNKSTSRLEPEASSHQIPNGHPFSEAFPPRGLPLEAGQGRQHHVQTLVVDSNLSLYSISHRTGARLNARA